MQIRTDEANAIELSKWIEKKGKESKTVTDAVAMALFIFTRMVNRLNVNPRILSKCMNEN